MLHQAWSQSRSRLDPRRLTAVASRCVRPAVRWLLFYSRSTNRLMRSLSMQTWFAHAAPWCLLRAEKSVGTIIGEMLRVSWKPRDHPAANELLKSECIRSDSSMRDRRVVFTNTVDDSLCRHCS